MVASRLSRYYHHGRDGQGYASRLAGSVEVSKNVVRSRRVKYVLIRIATCLQYDHFARSQDYSVVFGVVSNSLVFSHSTFLTGFRSSQSWLHVLPLFTRYVNNDCFESHETTENGAQTEESDSERFPVLRRRRGWIRQNESSPKLLE